jgi:hypothetical protein
MSQATIRDNEYDEIEADARNEFAAVARDLFGQIEKDGIKLYWSENLSCYVTLPED